MAEFVLPLFLSWLALLLAIAVPSIILLIRERQTPFVQVRGFWSVIGQVVTITLYGISFCFKGLFSSGDVDGYQFRASTPVGNFLLFLNVLFAYERSIMLIISFRISTECVQRAQDKFQTSAEILPSYQPRNQFERNLYSWLLRNRRYFHLGPFSYSKISCWAFAIAFNLPTLICHQVLSDSAANIVGNASVLIFLVLFVGLISVSIYFLKPVQENFKIKKELSRLSLLGLATIILVAVVSTFTSKRPQEAYPMLRSVYICLSICEVLISCTWIVTEARRQRFNTSQNSTKSEVTNSKVEKRHSVVSSSLFARLVQMLEDETMRKKFEQFLIREFSVEELLFWSAVQKFKALNSEEHKRAVATEIYQEFCASNAQMCVNISSAVRSKLDSTFKEKALEQDISSEIFDDSVKEVLTMLAHDSFTRFTRQMKQETIQVSSVPQPI
jgi:hypothetical protein